jgi:nucleolin
MLGHEGREEKKKRRARERDGEGGEGEKEHTAKEKKSKKRERRRTEGAAAPEADASAAGAGAGSDTRDRALEEEGEPRERESAQAGAGELEAEPSAAPVTTPAEPLADEHGAGAPGGAPPGCLMYIGGLPFAYSEAEVRAAFAECGEIQHVHCMRFPDTGKFRGIALVTFADAAGADKAEAWDGQEWEGRFLVIKPGKALPKAAKAAAGTAAAAAASASAAAGGIRPDERPKPVGSTTAYLGNLNFDTTEAELHALFPACAIAGIRFATDKLSGRPKGIAFVEFADEDALERAMLMNGRIVRGRELAMHYSTTTGPSAKQRGRQPGGQGPARSKR